ncbi:hypothetical protein B0J18DRAFT_441043 [Chaetomium sp. MPI-SDFR-AT-0129]|nr:hypothetical protein B0J18DRAFT_441043 [Chaetomium sp. MPI-SDFR-AT-0129]
MSEKKAVPQYDGEGSAAAQAGARVRRSVYLEKLAAMPADYLSQRDPPPPPYKYKPIYYFFYDTHPSAIKEVLGLEKDPILRNAKILGYTLKSWGNHKAMVHGEPGEPVTGHAFLVRSVEDELRLAYHETRAFRLMPCWVRFTDNPKDNDEKEFGMTFVYTGGRDHLEQGVRFDWSLWECQMMLRLPPGWKKGADPNVPQKLGPLTHRE